MIKIMLHQAYFNASYTNKVHIRFYGCYKSFLHEKQSRGYLMLPEKVNPA